MKKFILFASFALLAACTSESTLDNGNDNGQSSFVELTSIVLDEHEITLEKGMEKVLKVEFFPENATNKKVTWTSSNENVVKVKDGVVVGVAPGTAEVIVRSLKNIFDKCKVSVIVSAQSISLDKTKLTLVPGETASLKATVLPEDSTEGVEWFSSDESVATVKEGEVSAISEGEVTITVKAGEQSATCDINVDCTVDLGLSVKWAACNIGAKTPEQYGDYYAWGEVETYYSGNWYESYNWKWKNDGYVWESYKWSDREGEMFKKYCPTYKADCWYGEGSPDGKTVLEPDDDVAHLKLGGKWRIPTYEEWNELITMCLWKWTTWNGKRGMLVESKLNGNSIFLPAGGEIGYQYEDSIYLRDKGGAYWSATLNYIYQTKGDYSVRRAGPETKYPPHHAWAITFAGTSGLVFDKVPKMQGHYRCWGRLIRPVTE